MTDPNDNLRRLMMALQAMTRDRRAMAAIKALAVLNVILTPILFGQDYFGWWRSPFPTAVDAALVGLLTAVSLTLFWFLALVGMLYFAFQGRRLTLTAHTPSRKMRVALGSVPYGLTALWGWAYQTDGETKLWGSLAVAFYLCYGVSDCILRTSEQVAELKQKRSGASGSGGNTPATPQTIARPSVRSILWRQWWHLTHPGYLKRMSVIDRSLYVAVVRGNTQNVTAFLKRGANPKLRLVYDGPLLGLAVSLGHSEIMRLLLEAGADPDAAGPSTRFTPLLIAAKDGNTGAVRLLLEHGASVNARIRGGATALTLAARRGNAETVALLLAHGAAVNGCSSRGATALMIAASKGHADVVRVLLDGGADARLKDSHENDALMFAKKKGHQEVIKLLSEREIG